MITTKIYDALEEIANIKKLEMPNSLTIDSLYGTEEKIYAISSYATEEELINKWELTSREVAVNVQSILVGEYSDLRWDIYLLLVVSEEEVSSTVRKKIENDRSFFRKIVLTSSDLTEISEKLFLTFNIGRENSRNDLIFNDKNFLTELKKCLSSRSIERLGEHFFEGNIPITKMLNLFRDKLTLEGGENAD
ncbi:hypothetical protein Desor_0686 [Desulfosporosinus orientis DSM 765]|uniref:Uncharacterized protein n=1 Tax=Desulfosporosinus orientis (strain ATCC 19365 / DSM 765 / NCIMB 8382 / VKM B-1628 / Singapore I) TaxID=768706 RepID=G7W5E8_DESOD|nr:ABC-three component system middle component 1 [Desulfosporosinus orientis]AET66376.1 hypothetical protein Desor_0686 [Desulfosporosinus orientis DSM 765]